MKRFAQHTENSFSQSKIKYCSSDFKKQVKYLENSINSLRFYLEAKI